MCPLAFAASQDRNGPVAAASASDIPRLRHRGTATQLIVDGKPFLVLGGELLNNSATGIEHMKPIWPKLAASKFNTVLAGVSWAQIEPVEGRFDFQMVDGAIQGARAHGLRLVLLWFGSWKNSLSSYAPDWLKRDFERFPRAQVSGGKSIELLSPLSHANRDADARAFAALMRHIRAVDGQRHTVIMIQVENEVGMHGDSRDRSPAANQAFEGPVPQELMDYLQRHKDTLIPEFRRVWEAAGFKTSGTWEEAFGKGAVTDGFFMAWSLARYIDRVAEAGKAEYPLPMFLNAALYGAGRGPQPRPSGGRPWDLVMDVWRAGAPQIDMLSPDIYSETDFVEFCAKYTQSGNPLFIPETGNGQTIAARALYAFGRHDAIGFSPFGIDRPDRLGNSPDLTGVYDLLSRAAPLILKHQGDGTMSAVLLGPKDPPQRVRVGNYTLEAAFWPIRYSMPLLMPGEPPPGNPPPAAALFIAAGPDEYFAIGCGVKVTFSPNTPGPPLVGLATVEAGAFVDGRWDADIRLAGDDTGQGLNLFELQRHMGIQRFTLYRYR
jgi:beta-galactosidase GanA